jgi:uncharacterized protein with ParB-like and HNH nuclease domain
MRKPEHSSYTTLDFLHWHEGGTLEITPKFQRRGVWNRAAQSYLIDTLLLDLPIPPIYLRIVQNNSQKAILREVVDGQQRINAVLSFVQNKFSLSKNIESPFVGKRFSELAKREQEKILHYSFTCEIFYGADDRDVLKIFARLNTYSVKLNDQELRNGRFFGDFKQTVYDLGFEHLEFWRRRRIFSELNIARMNEVELTSELMIAMIDGVQDKKKTIDHYYEKYDDQFSGRARFVRRFRETIDEINDSLGEILRETEFRRPPLFYSLFLAVCHRTYGVPGIKIRSPHAGKLTRTQHESLNDAVQTLSDAIEAAKKEDGSPPKEYERFVAACLRQTDNLRPRQTRLETIYRLAF